ncbi:AAA family ATPase [Candidatus Micrarchaeota archaeon]|nr:AAA family ATPase [Candidatus Micrarchaeota archaeon]
MGRKEEKKAFERLVENAKGGNPRSMAVIGDRGIGKTALLAEFERIAMQKGCVVVGLELHEGVKTLGYLSVAILDAMQKQLRVLSLKEKAKNRLLAFFQRVEVKYRDIGVSLRKPEAKAKPELDLHGDLKELWRQLKEVGVPVVVIQIDEAEGLERIDGALTFLKNTFQKLGQDKCNYVAVLGGKIDFYKKVEELHSPIARFFPQTELKPLTIEETAAYVHELMEKRGKTKVSADAIPAIHVLSDGNPFALNAICDVLFEKAQEAHKTIDKPFLQMFRQELVNKAGSGLFQKRYVLLSDVEKEILEVIARESSKKWPNGAPSLPELSTSEVAKLTKKSLPYASSYLDRLAEKECLVKKGRGKFALPYVLFGWYVMLASGSWSNVGKG